MKNREHNIIILMVSSSVFLVSGYLISVWLGRELGPTEYGIYGVIISLMTAVNIIQTSGLPQATSKFIASGKHNVDEILNASLRLQIISTGILTLLFFIFAYPLSLLLNDATLVGYIRATAFILPFYAIFALYSSYYNGLHNFKRQAFINIVYSLAKVISVIGLVYIFHLYGAIIGFIIAPIVALLFGFHLPKAVPVAKELYRSLILFSLPLIGFAALSTLLLSIDLFFVKALLADDKAAGLYTASQNIARIPYFALSAFAMMLLPTISRSVHTESAQETEKRIRETFRYLSLFLIPGTVLIAATSSQLLQLLYTESYVSAADSLAWLVVGLAFITVFAALANVIIAMGRPGTAMIIAGGGLSLAVLFCWLLIPHFGLVGASIATMIGGGVAMLLALLVVSRQFPHIVSWVSTMKIFLASAGMYVVSIFIHLLVLWLPLVYIILAVVYGIILLVLREITREDLLVLKRMIPSRTPIIAPYE